MHHQPSNHKPGPAVSVAIVKPPENRPPARIVDARFGLCPRCREWGGEFVRDGRKDIYAICRAHNTAWFCADVGKELKGKGVDPKSIAGGVEEVSPIFPAECHWAYKPQLHAPRPSLGNVPK